MEEIASSTILDAQIVGIKFGLASHKEICAASISDCSISHASQLSNPFLGLPLEFGKCESCGTSEPGKCEGHFGYIELPIPIYHPSHVNELKRMLSLLCLKCLKMRSTRFTSQSSGIAQRLLSSCCDDPPQVSIREVKTSDGACYLEMKLPSRFKQREGAWNFLARYGFRYGENNVRPLLPSEVKEILKKLPAQTREKLSRKGYFPQDGYILEYLPVPPNCLSVPDVSDGMSVMSSDLSISVLKKVLKQVEIIKGSRSGAPNFESQVVEANDLQAIVDQYLQVRGTAKAARDVDARFGVNKESSNSSTKAWLEKMRTLFIRKGSGFSSRSVITGDAYKRVNEVGIPYEIAQRITFEERVNFHNMKYLQELVDNKLCLTYRDGSSTYSLREGSKGHTFLRPGQVVHRRIMDGDIVFINRPPTTHKHSLQALSVYVHDDHTVKINPLICGPLSADFDGDCIHLFYPQSVAAKAEVVELFSVDKQLLSSHSGNLNLQLGTDSLLSLKVLIKKFLLEKESIQQLAMFVPSSLPQPAFLKGQGIGPRWTALQLLETVLPESFDSPGDRFLIKNSELLEFDYSREFIPSAVNEMVASMFFEKGPKEVLKFFDCLQPLLMENVFAEGFSVSLEDFAMPVPALRRIQRDIKQISPLLEQLRSTQNELLKLQLESSIRHIRSPVASFILRSSALGNLFDSKSESAIIKVVQQTGFLGLQLSDKGKYYSKEFFDDIASYFQRKYPRDLEYPSAKYGLIKGSFFHGLDPYEKLVHSISTREVIVRSSRGLSEPGTLFKNLMAILRDVVICYDGTVRNVCSNSIIEFEYGVDERSKSASLFPPGEPVGVLAATAMSNPAYKAVLDASPNSNSSWELMKEILQCRVGFKNDHNDRRVILYLNDCNCGRKHCQERAAYVVKNQLHKVTLKDTAVEFLIQYEGWPSPLGSLEMDAGLVGHIHLSKMQLERLNITMPEIVRRCQENIHLFCKKKKLGRNKKEVYALLKGTLLSFGECSDVPCLMFKIQNPGEIYLEKLSYILANMIYPVLLETIVKGDPRISSANIIWINPDTTTWVRNPSKIQKGELAIDVVIEKSVVKQSGDAWRIALDSCVPVLHLIDTGRSIPYAIKQIQELLGISCSFEQAVQRLSTSVNMVAKGVRREHLILLANSMTCSGNLVGFNPSGYKALFKSLNVEVPFTEATLSKPRTCFEKAAEKCHTDNLSSVVASCSWGKHVAVGTGSRFDILWNAKEVELKDQEEGLDVYNFLNMVNGPSAGETNTGCLGLEVDELEPDDEAADWSLSPVHDDSEKPVFEDSAQFQNLVDEPEDTTWGKASSGDDGGWGAKVSNKSESDGSGWGAQKANDGEGSNKSGGWDGAATWGKRNDNSLISWGKKATGDDSGSSGHNEQLQMDQVDEPSGWGNKVTQKTESQSSLGWGATPTWGKKSEEKSEDWGSSGWGAQDQRENVDTTGSWGGKATEETSGVAKRDESCSGWDNKVTQKTDSQLSSGWGTTPTWDKKSEEKSEDGGSSSWGAKAQKYNLDTTGAWGGKAREETIGASQKDDLSCRWGNKVTKESSSSWGSKPTWGKKVEDRFEEVGAPGPKASSAWGAKAPDEGAASWGKQNADAGGSWSKKNVDASSPWGKKGVDAGGSWGKKALGAGFGSSIDGGDSFDQGRTSGGWGNKATPKKQTREDGATGWGKKSADAGASWGTKAAADKFGSGSNGGDEDGNNSGGWGNKVTWEKEIGKAEDGGSWGQQKSAWGKKATQEKGDNGSWGQQKPAWGNQGTQEKEKDAEDKAEDGGSWGQQKSVWGNKANQEKEDGGSWGQQKSAWGAKATPEKGDGGSWGQQKSAEEKSHKWDSATDSKQPSSQEWNVPESKGTSEGAWGQKKTSEASQNWGSGGDSTQQASSNPWDVKDDGDNENENNQWGQPGKGFKKKRFPGSSGGGRGSNSGEWKGNRNRPPRPPGMAGDDSVANAMYTVTRQRLDMFTSEEQDILTEIEPTMRSIRKIMQGCTDDNPLSADDQTFIIDNVLNHHPDKAGKIGAGVEHLTVSKHGSFQETRCFFVVSTDGSRQDFSYRKCLDNYIRGKYPELADAFLDKYFKKPHNRNENRSLPLVPEVTKTPVSEDPEKTLVTEETKSEEN